MKVRATTLIAKLRANRVKVGLVVAAMALAIVAPFQILSSTNNASADQYDDQIASLTAQMTQYQAQADALNSQAVTLQNTVAQLDNEKAAIQAQVDLNQAQYDQLTQQITDTENQITDNQNALAETLADLYVDGQVSPIEMLASSNNISQYLDKQEYRSSIEDQLTSTIKTIQDLKTQLTDKQTAVAKVLADQTAARDNLAAKEAEQQTLLNETNNDESTYQSLISSNASKIAEARATQAVIRARLNSTGGYTLIDAGSLSAYPWNSSNCPMLSYYSTGGSDGNGGDGHGYGCRQCASYVAWRIAKETGIYYKWGDAVDFTQNAISAGYKEGGPQAGSIAVMDPATAGASQGHVAWVESNNGDGTITVSQYNYDYGQGYGMYSEMKLSVNAFDHYVHISPNN